MTQNPPRTVLIVKDFEPDDLLRLDVQDQQISATEMVAEGEAAWLQRSGPGFTALRADGTVLACIGLTHLWDGRATAWALLSRHLGRDMLPLTRAIRAWLARDNTVRRIEAYIDPAFLQAHRWARLLGFQQETAEPMPGFYPNGRSAYMYARVR